MDLWKRRREERRAVDEGGGGVSEGFELAESDLIDHASHTDQLGAWAILYDALPEPPEISDAVYGEADDSRLRDWY